MSAGFGAVFGTPVAGAVFALEVIAIGRIKYDALIPCLIAGSDMPTSLREAVARVPEGRAEALGWVASLDELFARVRLTAAPLRYGAGLKGKVLVFANFWLFVPNFLKNNFHSSG